MLTVRVLDGVARVEAAAWDGLVAGRTPWLAHAFLAAVEAGSAVPRHGVAPRHVTLWDGERLVGLAPLYLKADVRGEFFYGAWPELVAARANHRWYPKLVSMAPFSPVEVEHLVLEPGLAPALVDARRAALFEAARDVARAEGASGVHWLFVPPDEAAWLAGRGALLRAQAHPVWSRAGERTFEDYLAGMRSKERVRTRRELRRLDEAGVTIDALEGDAVEAEDLAHMERWYRASCARHATGSDYLKPATWRELLAWRRHLVLFVARRGGAPIGGSLCVRGRDDLWGRYWGAAEDVPFVFFALTAYRPIAWAIERGLSRVHAGAGATLHKVLRGYASVAAEGALDLLDPALARALAPYAARERELVAAALGAGTSPA